MMSTVCIGLVKRFLFSSPCYGSPAHLPWLDRSLQDRLTTCNRVDLCKDEAHTSACCRAVRYSTLRCHNHSPPPHFIFFSMRLPQVYLDFAFMPCLSISLTEMQTTTMNQLRLLFLTVSTALQLRARSEQEVTQRSADTET